MRSIFSKRSAACLTALALAGIAGEANAAPCADLPNPIYVIGSSAVKPFLQALGTQLSGATTAYTIVYQSPGSCNGVDAVFNGTKMTGTGTYWAASTDGGVSGDTTCDLDVNGVAADVGASDVFSTSCTSLGSPAVPATVGDFFGPIQVMEPVVPAKSTQHVISAEALYLVYGFGGAATNKTAWNDPTLIFKRDDKSGTQQMIGHGIKVPALKWLGTPQSGSGGMLAALTAQNATPASADKTIGVISGDFADKNRDPDTGIRTLAVQFFGQYCGFFPDSGPSTFDKANVRDGHYPFWGPIHFFAAKDGTGQPSNPKAKVLLDFFTAPTQAMLKLESDNYVIPQCAMKVSRTDEVGVVEMKAATGASCGCYFDSLRKTGGTTCTACPTDGDCAGGKVCHYGYCEDR